MKTILGYIISFVFLISGCSAQNQEKIELQRLCVSPDSEYILFSYSENNLFSIYRMRLDGGYAEKFIDTKNNLSFLNPSFSPDGKKVVFIGYDNDSFSSNIYISNSEGTEILQLTFGNQIITQVIFSSDGNKLYFNKAEEYDKYSPIGIKDAHNFDIYCLMLENNHVDRLTKIEAFQLSNISLMEFGKYIIMDV
ncbi:MAG: hypothetical protein M0P66_15515, partial [Salinivirgaceae bacterium]|nr:hypothetical protein [Salinivirgaceae bacterium]